MSEVAEYMEKLIHDSEERAVEDTLDTGGAAVVLVFVFEWFRVICR